MNKINLTMAQQVAQAASDFQRQRTGHVPKAVTAVLSEDTLVITLHGALSPAEEALAKTQKVPRRCRIFTGSCLPIPASHCDRKSKESQGWPCAKPVRKSRRVPAPSCRYLRLAEWCKCSCSLLA